MVPSQPPALAQAAASPTTAREYPTFAPLTIGDAPPPGSVRDSPKNPYSARKAAVSTAIFALESAGKAPGLQQG